MFQDILHSLQNQYTVGEFRHDLALVRYINQVSRARKINIAQLLVCKWSDIAPTEGELSSMPLLKDLIHMVDSRVSLHGGEEESKNSTDGHNMPMCAPPVHTPTEGSETVLRPIEARFKLLQLLNKALSTTVPFFDLCTVDKPWSVASLLSACRGLVFEATKQPIWDAGMAATNCSNSSTFDLKLSRSRAAKFHRTGQVDNEGRWMVFSQAFRVLHTMPPSALRRSDKVYNCTFMGERAHDAGGPYRESYAMMALELQSHALPLLIRTPNSRHNVGQNREKWVLNPGATSSLHMDMFCFLGKLMGIAVRTKEYLALDIPSIIWKLLVNETPTREDLEGIDLFKVQSLDKMRNIHLHQVDASTFSSVFYETFTTVTTDARTVELLPGGAEKDLTFENRDYYCDLIEHYRLHEFDAQAAAVRRGLAAMLPYRLLSLFTWDQLEEMVCGRPIIDVALLRSVTEYSSCSSTDEHVQYFWQAMEEFTNEERSIFIRFTWGRSRLPLTADAFPQRFKLQSFGKSPPDAYLPVAHTCFFSLELPRYSTLEIMKEKLRYAIFNCQAIDGDDTSVGMQAASMGWED